MIEPEVPAVNLLAVSLAVMVCGPAVFNITTIAAAPPLNVASAGNTAWESVLVK
jgi:hypothetical protein